MTSQAYTEHEKYANSADDYLDQVSSRHARQTDRHRIEREMVDGNAKLTSALPRCINPPLLQHNVYEMFAGLLRKLVIHKPKDPLSFMITALEQPVQQVSRKQRRGTQAATPFESSCMF
jgi:hypothetical protein